LMLNMQPSLLHAAPVSCWVLLLLLLHPVAAPSPAKLCCLTAVACTATDALFIPQLHWSYLCFALYGAAALSCCCLCHACCRYRVQRQHLWC
jgi:hypothetical protein